MGMPCSAGLQFKGGQAGFRLRRGFTLVELLVVIGIIALLVALLMPALNAARQQSQLVVCASNLRQTYQSLALYAHDNQGWLPPVQFTNPGPPSVFAYWMNHICPIAPPNNWIRVKNYLGNPEVLTCPSAVRSWSSGGTLRGTYGMNYRMVFPNADKPRWHTTDRYNNQYYNLQKTRTPQEVYLLGDTSFNPANGIYNPQLVYGNADARHRPGKLNIAFHDGHVEALYKKSVAPRSDVLGTEVYRVRPWWGY
jgi:prepilin-type N-terminal cleavage/methylation domain-containing protein/prepilin-type processing-associated H-X9-DG protein